MIITLAVVAGFIAFYFVLTSVQPLTEGSVITAEEWQRLEDETLLLLQRRDRVFAEIRELDFESALNKVDANDFVLLKRKYEDEAIEIMDQLQSAFDTYGERIESDMASVIAAARARRAGVETSSETRPDAAATSLPNPGEVERNEASSPREIPASSVAVEPGVSAVPATTRCVACAADLPPDSAFCDTCGARQISMCGHCGTENRVGASFCKSCGHAMEAEEAHAEGAAVQPKDRT